MEGGNGKERGGKMEQGANAGITTTIKHAIKTYN